MSRSAPAPSLICDAVPAVWNAGSRSSTGFEVGERLERGVAQPFVARDGRGTVQLAVLVERRRLDRHDLGVEATFGPRLARRGPATACRSASSSSRVRPNFSAMRSAPSNWLRALVVLPVVRLIGLPTNGSLGTVEPIGTALITSTPQAMATATGAGQTTGQVAGEVGLLEEQQAQSRCRNGSEPA